MGGDYFPFPKDETIIKEKIESFSTKIRYTNRNLLETSYL